VPFLSRLGERLDMTDKMLERRLWADANIEAAEETSYRVQTWRRWSEKQSCLATRLGRGWPL